jgi:hypothetical protein
MDGDRMCIHRIDHRGIHSDGGRSAVLSDLPQRMLMQINGPRRQSAIQDRYPENKDMKSIHKTAQEILVQLGRSGQFRDYDGEWPDGAVVRLLLDALLHDLSETYRGAGWAADEIAMSGCSDNPIDGLIYTSAEMRGLVFRTYARRITDLMSTGGATGMGGHRLN